MIFSRQVINLRFISFVLQAVVFRVEVSCFPSSCERALPPVTILFLSTQITLFLPTHSCLWNNKSAYLVFLLIQGLKKDGIIYLTAVSLFLDAHLEGRGIAVFFGIPTGLHNWAPPPHARPESSLVRPLGLPCPLPHRMCARGASQLWMWPVAAASCLLFPPSSDGWAGSWVVFIPKSVYFIIVPCKVIKGWYL